MASKRATAGARLPQTADRVVDRRRGPYAQATRLVRRTCRRSLSRYADSGPSGWPTIWRSSRRRTWRRCSSRRPRSWGEMDRPRLPRSWFQTTTSPTCACWPQLSRRPSRVRVHVTPAASSWRSGSDHGPPIDYRRDLCLVAKSNNAVRAW